MRDIESGHIPRSAERQEETRRQGRNVLYEELYRLLPEKQREAFKLINVALADLDDVVDQTNQVGLLLDAAELLSKAYQGEKTPVVEEWQQDIQRLGELLRELNENGFDAADRIYQETLNFWEADRKDKDRKSIVCDQATLDQLNTDIGRTVAAQFLLFFCPDLSSEELENLSRLYGLAVKTADNLSDLERDLKTGFVNISNENMQRYILEIEDHEGELSLHGDLHAYKVAEVQRLELLFAEAQTTCAEIERRFPEYQRELTLLKSVFTSWLQQAKGTLT